MNAVSRVPSHVRHLMNALSHVLSYVCFFRVPSVSPHRRSSYTAKYYSLIELCLTGILLM